MPFQVVSLHSPKNRHRQTFLPAAVSDFYQGNDENNFSMGIKVTGILRLAHSLIHITLHDCKLMLHLSRGLPQFMDSNLMEDTQP